MESAQSGQRYGKHRAIDNSWVVLFFVILALNILTAIAAFSEPGLLSLSALGIAFVLIPLLVKMRRYGTKVQTRIIRMEVLERMREELEGELYAKAREELSYSQLAGLRFAGKAEFAELTAAAIDENLSKDDIMRRVKDWQADWFRV